MNTRTQKKIISPEEESVIDSSSSGQVTVAAREARAPRKTITVTKPRLPAAIADARLDYYAWVFSQRGFSNLEMTFEQFLTVVATVHPSGLSPEYDPTDI
jgi:G:T/U-mismatch repair DNA glycosylase